MPFYTTGVVDSEPMAKGDAMPLILGAAAAVLLLTRKKGCAANCSDVRADGGTVAGIRYREFRSDGVGPNDPAPMLIRFHGLGSTSSSLDTAGKSWAGSRTRGPVRVIVPESPRLTDPNKYYTWWRLQARTSKQVELAQQMSEAGAEMDEFLCQIVKCRPTQGLPVVVGHSQGGSMVYLVSTLSPAKIRGGVTAAGWLPRSLWSPSIAPLLATHGTQDSTVPYGPTSDHWEMLEGAGAPFESKAYAQGHEALGNIAAYMTRGVNRLFGYS
jgi:predicted esterase